MKRIPIKYQNRKTGKVGRYEALVDDVKYEQILSWGPWFLSTGAYARNKDGTLMHRLIMGAHKDSPRVDHINRNRLDNQLCNLRFATAQENSRNRCAAKRVRSPKTHRRRKTSSKYKGVFACRSGFQARIGESGETTYLGWFKTAREAALAYDLAAESLFKEHAVLNLTPEQRAEIIDKIRQKKGIKVL